MTVARLVFEELSGGYDDTQILSKVSGRVSTGEVLGVFGRNGVGKTTLSRLLAGQIPAQSGSIEIDGKNIVHTRNFERRQLGLGYMPQTEMVFDNLTVRENLSLAKTERDIAPFFETFPRLAERQDQLAGSMSGGERKILSFVRTMLEDTSTIILDEPSEGVQQENIENMQTCILERKGRGTAFILIEQNLNMLLNVSDQFLGLDAGAIVYSSEKVSTKRRHLIEILSV